MPNVPQCVIAFYGTLKAGAIVVLGSPLSYEDEIAYQIRDSGAQVLLTLSSYQTMVERLCADTNIKQVILTDVREYLPVRQRVMIASLVEGSESQSAGATYAGEYVEEIAGGEKSRNNSTPGFAAEVMPLVAQKKTYRVYSFQRLLRSQNTTPLNSGTGPDDLALVQYTSGTTDMPKGVMLTHTNLMANVVQMRHWIQDARHGKEVVLCVLPLSHSYGITSCMNYAIATAASLVLLPTGRTEQILKAIKVPAQIEFRGELPKNLVGKVLRRLLVEA